MGEKKSCDGESEFIGEVPNKKTCSDACKSKATMIAFGRSPSRCNAQGNCHCYCILAADSDGTCVQKDHDGYNIYAISKSNKIYGTYG